MLRNMQSSLRKRFCAKIRIFRNMTKSFLIFFSLFAHYIYYIGKFSRVRATKGDDHNLQIKCGQTPLEMAQIKAMSLGMERKRMGRG